MLELGMNKEETGRRIPSMASLICGDNTLQQGFRAVRFQPRPVRPFRAQQISREAKGVDAVPVNLVASAFDQGHPVITDQQVVGVQRMLNALRRAQPTLLTELEVDR